MMRMKQATKEIGEASHLLEVPPLLCKHQQGQERLLPARNTLNPNNRGSYQGQSCIRPYNLSLTCPISSHCLQLSGPAMMLSRVESQAMPASHFRRTLP